MFFVMVFTKGRELVLGISSGLILMIWRGMFCVDVDTTRFDLVVERNYERN